MKPVVIMRSLLTLLIALSVSVTLHAGTENDTTFILRKAGEYPEHPEKIRRAEISAYVYRDNSSLFSNEFLRIIPQLSKWPNLNSLLITHVDQPDMVAACRKMLAELSDKKQLRSLDIRASFGLIPLPEELFSIRSLEELAIWDMRIKELPGSIGDLTNLRELYFLGTDDVSIPAEIAGLKKLRKAYFHGIDFSNVNSTLQGFASSGSVCDLTFIGCSYPESPKIAALFPQLTSLMSDGLCNQWDEILTLKKLRYLSLSCIVDDSLRAEITRSLPGCEVILEQEFCFPGSARVSTLGGQARITEIMPGDIVKTINPETRREDTAIVLRVEKHPARICTMLRIELTVDEMLASCEFIPALLTLEITPNHPVFLENGAIRSARELQEGDRLVFLSATGKIKTATITRTISETRETELYNLVTSKGSYLVDSLLVSDKF